MADFDVTLRRILFAARPWFTKTCGDLGSERRIQGASRNVEVCVVAALTRGVLAKWRSRVGASQIMGLLKGSGARGQGPIIF